MARWTDLPPGGLCSQLQREKPVNLVLSLEVEHKHSQHLLVHEGQLGVELVSEEGNVDPPLGEPVLLLCLNEVLPLQNLPYLPQVLLRHSGNLGHCPAVLPGVALGRALPVLDDVHHQVGEHSLGQVVPIPVNRAATLLRDAQSETSFCGFRVATLLLLLLPGLLGLWSEARAPCLALPCPLGGSGLAILRGLRRRPRVPLPWTGTLS